jgi:myo-inositol 2-dehydrogenase/D-chiro-inositol 1-dehydrogenase
MNVLILGDGTEERAWASWFMAHSHHHLEAVYPGFVGEEFAGIHVASDLDEALATAGIDLAVVGGPLAHRAEALRRAAAEGLAILCIHPPGADSEAYYQVALSKSETGAVVVPVLPLRLHPGVVRLQQSIATGDLGTIRGIRHESSANPADGDYARMVFSRMVDVVRTLIGEIDTLTASGDPPGEHPDTELVVQLRGALGRRAEIRIWSGGKESARLSVSGAHCSLALEYDPSFQEPARLVRRGETPSGEQTNELESWDPLAAIMETLSGHLESRGPHALAEPRPSLDDGIRAMEISEAVVRSLRRGRTIDLHYETISEESSFKSIMTSTGCVILMAALFILPLTLAGPALGFNWTIYLAYFIPPVLVVFAVCQILRFGIRGNPRDIGRAHIPDNRPEGGGL